MPTIKKATIRINERYELTCDECGFTLWNIQNGSRYWLLDASCFSDDGEVRLGLHTITDNIGFKYDKKNNKLVLKNKKK